MGGPRTGISAGHRRGRLGSRAFWGTFVHNWHPIHRTLESVRRQTDMKSATVQVGCMLSNTRVYGMLCGCMGAILSLYVAMQRHASCLRMAPLFSGFRTLYYSKAELTSAKALPFRTPPPKKSASLHVYCSMCLMADAYEV